ncbi:enolase C-terminal domain-like protein [Crateriforma spongiae]|uniref:enolase C-terminal domain-like protein n=1 Tax=Crateriforma spongiae TaxID=2724528 RepID=UPI0014488965|nr:enolase C-terminal domain-like protein [Crateriforma spongiae]
MPTIKMIETRDARFPLKPGEGVDAVHSEPVYSYAVTHLRTDTNDAGTGIAFTLGGGNRLVCEAIELLTDRLIGQDIEDLMSRWGVVSRELADHPQLRWLGPHKGVVHLALSSIANACFDLWAKARQVPLWKLLIDLSPEAIVDTLDLTYLEEVLSREQAIELLNVNRPGREDRMQVVRNGYPGYDTSVGWFTYADDVIVANAKKALDAGFTAMKLKVGSADSARDLRRAELVRDVVGESTRLMFDANQAWNLPRAMDMCQKLADLKAFWIEEPTHPDDVLGHQKLSKAIAPSAIALGEHVPNRVMFKNFILAGAMQFVQVDAVRVAGVSEFIAISMLARQKGLKVVPHVGDMGQLHQHLVLFNHISLGHERVFLEYIPHLRDHFVHPADVDAGIYRTPDVPGATCDLKEAKST